MFDVGFTELVLVFVIALIVLGPERLPKVARAAGRWVGRARQMARSMQYELERELDLKDIGRDITSSVTPPRYGAPPGHGAEDEDATTTDSIPGDAAATAADEAGHDGARVQTSGRTDGASG